MASGLLTSKRDNEDIEFSSDSESSDEFDSSALKADDLADRYFLAQGTKSKASKNSFATKLEKFDLEEEDIKKIIQSSHEHYCKKANIVPYDDKTFRKIYDMATTTDLNVLVYGFGSKLKMLTELSAQYFRDHHHHIVLRGFSMDITLKQVMLVMNRAVDNADNPILNELELLDLVKEYYDANKVCLYIFVHSIDVLFTKNVKIAAFLMRTLQAMKNVRIIASVDHVNSPLLWSIGESSIYKWTWFEVNTHEPYSMEKKSSSGISMISTNSKSWKLSMNLSSVKHVYESLNANAQKIFVIILKYFMENNKTSGYPFHDLYLNCRQEFLVNSQITLHAQLSEFKDHHLLKIKKAQDGSELIALNVDKETVRQFVHSLEN